MPDEKLLDSNQLGATFIVTGTGLDIDVIQEALNLSFAKPRNTVEAHVTPVFEDMDSQWQYISRFLPPDYISNNLAREVLPHRIFRWLRGRNRFTAEYISVLLRTGLQSPHRALSRFIEEITGFRPTDASALCKEEPEINISLPYKPINVKMIEEKARPLLERMRDNCHNYLLRSELLRKVGAEEKKYVQHGLAWFSEDSLDVYEPVVEQAKDNDLD
ncbi:hypothetical protein MPER_05006 [Moniliophthora perniciosa FA553]|nr:hypothetical protein MPER_05006 [Moniliophthora perniciosa FA553]